MSSNSDIETKTEIFSQFIVYTLFAIVTTIINLGGQVLFTNILLLDYVVSAVIALAIGYSVKFFLDCFITFKNQRREEVDLRKHYLVYMMTAVIFYLLNVVIQIFIATPIVKSLFLDPLTELIIAVGLSPEPVLVTLLSATAAVAVVFLIKFPFDKYIIFKLLPEKMGK
ncbi:MAG: GtrA family protein [Candidatus Helarchaeota archaeon]|nr:GtrA family protein [Candidatus Helarchaeota archaeon]